MAKKNELAKVKDGALVDATIDREDAERKLARVKEINVEVEGLWWEYGTILHDIWENTLYMLDGHKSWPEYVEHELDISYSSAQKFVSTHKWLKGFDEDFQSWVHQMGSGKARIMAGHIQPDDADVWRKRLEGCTCREIESILRGKDPKKQITDGAPDAAPVAAVTDGADYGSDGYDDGLPPHVKGDAVAPDDALQDVDFEGSSDVKDVHVETERPEFVSFSLFPEQKALVNTAIDQAKQIGQTDKDGYALELVCTGYLSSEGAHASLGDYLAAVERATGHRLVAFTSNYAIAYGEETLELVATASEDE